MERQNQLKYENLRSQFPIFVYRSFSVERSKNTLVLTFYFECGKYRFTPSTSLQVSSEHPLLELPEEALNNLAFHIGMVESLSYWKAFCSPTFIVESVALSELQTQWWTKLFFLGLGEFFYTNGIAVNQSDFLIINALGTTKIVPFSLGKSDKFLVPIGGGKDSAVSLELLKSLNKRVVPFAINPRGATEETILAANFSLKSALFVNRNFDTALLELNRDGFLNGHTPFSAMLAFTTLLVAAATGISNIALSNEASANESTVIGTDVNHQYSKSWEFESDFRSYVARYISPDLNYFSLLRPLSELQIALLFSKFSQHHSHFKSCNVGSKQNRWCCNCSKCLFTWIILSPFLSPEHLTAIFGENLLENEDNRDFLNELRGFSNEKPFECVGTLEEVNCALNEAVVRFPELKKSKLLQGYKPVSAPSINTILQHFEVEHAVPDILLSHLKAVLTSKL